MEDFLRINSSFRSNVSIRISDTALDSESQSKVDSLLLSLSQQGKGIDGTRRDYVSGVIKTIHNLVDMVMNTDKCICKSTNYDPTLKSIQGEKK